MSYDADPVVWDHLLVIGDTYNPGVVALVDRAGDPLDLTGVTGVAQLQTEPGGAVVLDATVAIVDAAAGQFRWTASATATADVPAGTYHYAVRLTWPDDTARTVLLGTVHARLVL